jgi:PEP-CTERM motif
MLRFVNSRVVASALALVGLAMAPAANAALVFNFSFIAGTSAAVQNGFNAAASRWSALFDDNVTLNMTVGSGSLGGSILAQAGSAESVYGYTTVRNALTNDRTSLNDFTAVSSLQTTPDFALLINRTSDSPTGANSATPYLDSIGANNRSVVLTSANAKALGLNVTPTTVAGCIGTCDAFIQFSDTVLFDFDPSDGIAVGTYDFVGIAVHELGHALGFTSGVDVLDASPGFSANAYNDVSALDLFRFSALSTSMNAIDWTADSRSKYFSLDRGVTSLAAFATGVNFGDQSQASHWQASGGYGLFGPTVAPGTELAISGNDATALDVIGWNLSSTTAAVPEPSTWMMLIAGFAISGWSLRRERRPGPPGRQSA